VQPEAAALDVGPPPEAPPPAEEEAPLLLQNIGPIDLPRSPEDIVHNIMVRQLVDDAQSPPPATSTSPALALLAKLQQRKDKGESLAPLQAEVARVTQGQEIENQVTKAVFDSHVNRKVLTWMIADEEIDAFLLRCFKRGDLTPTEAIVLKKLSMSQLAATAEDLRKNLKEGMAFNPSDILKMDYSLQIQEHTMAKQFAGTTPQGREIIRKITMKARRKIYNTEG